MTFPSNQIRSPIVSHDDLDVQAYWQLTGSRQLSGAGIDLTEQQARRVLRGLSRLRQGLGALPDVDVMSFEKLTHVSQAVADQAQADAQAQFNAMLLSCR